MKIAILNAVTLNAGDAAILLGLMAALRETADGPVEFVVSESSPEAAARLHPDIRFFRRFGAGHRDWPRPFRSLGKRIRQARIALAVRCMPRHPALGRRFLAKPQLEWLDLIATCDVAISTGGTYFVEHYPIIGKAFEILAAHSLGIPVYLYTQSLGPFSRRRSGALMRRVVHASERTYLRDEASRDALLAIGADPERLSVCADSAFTLTASAPARPSDQRSDPVRIALSVRSWRHFAGVSVTEGRQRYVEAIRTYVARLSATGHHVTFLSTCQGVPEYAHDDAATAHEIAAPLLKEGAPIIIDRSFRRPEQIIAAYAGFDLVVATRMHAAIMALIAGTPVIGIAYETKTTHLFAGIGLSALTRPIETADAEWLHERTVHVLGRRTELRVHIQGCLPSLRSSALTPAQAIVAAYRTSAT